MEEFGYPEITDDIKAKIFGLNAARLYDIDVDAVRCTVPSDQLAQAKAAYPDDRGAEPADLRTEDAPRVHALGLPRRTGSAPSLAGLSCVAVIHRRPYPRDMAVRWRALRPPPPWRDRSIEERDRAIQSACRAAMQMLADAPNRVDRLRRIDPVPDSTRAILGALVRRHG